METNKHQKSAEELRADVVKQIKSIMIEMGREDIITKRVFAHRPLAILNGKNLVDFSDESLNKVITLKNAFYLPLIESRADLAFAPLKPGNEIASEHKAILYPIPIISSWDFNTAKLTLAGLIYDGFQRFIIKHGDENGAPHHYQLAESTGNGGFDIKGANHFDYFFESGIPSVQALSELMNEREANFIAGLLQRYNSHK